MLLEDALAAFAETGAKAAYAKAQQVLAARESVGTLEAIAEEDEGADGMVGTIARRTSLATLRNLDSSLLETDVLARLLSLGGGADAIRAAQAEIQPLRERISSWILSREHDHWPRTPGMHPGLIIRLFRSVVCGRFSTWSIETSRTTTGIPARQSESTVDGSSSLESCWTDLSATVRRCGAERSWLLLRGLSMRSFAAERATSSMPSWSLLKVSAVLPSFVHSPRHRWRLTLSMCSSATRLSSKRWPETTETFLRHLTRGFEILRPIRQVKWRRCERSSFALEVRCRP